MKSSNVKPLGAVLAITLALGSAGVVSGTAQATERLSESLDIPCTVLAEGVLKALPDLQNCLIVTFDEGEWDGEKMVSTLGLSYAASELTKAGFTEGVQAWLAEFEDIPINGVVLANVQWDGDTVSYDAVRVADDFLLRSYVVEAGSYPDVTLTVTEY